jgi:hypothetical protein
MHVQANVIPVIVSFAILKLKSLLTDSSLVLFSKDIWHEERHLTLHRYQGMDCGF